jgi:hypothetical protein
VQPAGNDGLKLLIFVLGAGDERLGEILRQGRMLSAVIFTCAHPALPMEGRVPLTLKVVAGLS